MSVEVSVASDREAYGKLRRLLGSWNTKSRIERCRANSPKSQPDSTGIGKIAFYLPTPPRRPNKTPLTTSPV